MTDPDTRTSRRRRGRALLRVGCGVFLLALHVVGGYFVLVALMTRSEGPWDRSVTDTARMAALLGLLTEALAAGLTVAFVRGALLRRWWYVLPAVFVLLAVGRMLFAPQP